MQIHIKDKDIELKQTLRSLILFEHIADHTFTGKNITELHLYFYCVVMASCKDLMLDYEEFTDWLDEHVEEWANFSAWLTESSNRNSITDKGKEKSTTSKKKRSAN